MSNCPLQKLLCKGCYWCKWKEHDCTASKMFLFLSIDSCWVVLMSFCVLKEVCAIKSPPPPLPTWMCIYNNLLLKQKGSLQYLDCMVIIKVFYQSAVCSLYSIAYWRILQSQTSWSDKNCTCKYTHTSYMKRNLPFVWRSLWAMKKNALWPFTFFYLFMNLWVSVWRDFSSALITLWHFPHTFTLTVLLSDQATQKGLQEIKAEPKD